MAVNATSPPARQAVGQSYPTAGPDYSTLQGILAQALARRLLTILLLLNIAISAYWVMDRQDGLQDLGSFLHSGSAQRKGLNPYQYYPAIQPQPISPDALNLNPPITVYLFDALSRVDATALRHAFTAGSMLFFALGVLLLMRAYPDKRDPLVILTVASLAGVWHVLGYVQLYAPLFLAAVGAWLLMRQGSLLGAGLLIGLIVAIKPNFALWPLLLLAAGHRRIGLTALAGAAGLSAVPLVLDGHDLYRRWLELSLAFDGLQWASNASAASIGARFGLPTVGYAAGILAVGGLLAFAWRQRPSILQGSVLGIVAALLFGPASWAGYTLFLLPYLFSKPWTSNVWVCVLLLCTPFWLVHYLTSASPMTNALFGPAYGWAVVLLLTIVVAQQLEPSARRGEVRLRVAELFAPQRALEDSEPAA